MSGAGSPALSGSILASWAAADGLLLGAPPGALFCSPSQAAPPRAKAASAMTLKARRFMAGIIAEGARPGKGASAVRSEVEQGPRLGRRPGGGRRRRRPRGDPAHHGLFLWHRRLRVRAAHELRGQRPVPREAAALNPTPVS